MAFGKIISGLVKNAIRSSFNFELAINPLIQKLNTSCPSKSELDKIIKQKNDLNQALTQVQTSLNTLTQTGGVLNTINSSLNAGVNTIKALPIPSAAPPGVGVPFGAILTFSSTLDSLSLLISENKGVIGSINPSVNIINNSLNNIRTKINELNTAINLCLNQQSENLDDAQKEEFFEEINPDNNLTENLVLENRLQPNSNNPIIIDNFKLEIEYDKENKFSFPRRRVVGSRADGVKIVGDYSFSSSVQVLIDEVRFKISQFLNEELKNIVSPSVIYPPVGRAGFYDGEYYTFNQSTYSWNSRLDKWEIVTISFTTPFYPVGREGFYDGERVSVKGILYNWNSSTETWSKNL